MLEKDFFFLIIIYANPCIWKKQQHRTGNNDDLFQHILTTYGIIENIYKNSKEKKKRNIEKNI